MDKWAREAIIVFMFGIGVAAILSRETGASPLSDAAAGISSKTDAASMATTLLSRDLSDLIGKYRMTNAGVCALLVVGPAVGNFAPLYFIPGPLPVAALQADMMVGPGVTVNGITAGPAAVAAGKSVQSAPVSGGERLILFGINQNTVGAGNVANVSFDLTGASPGPHILALTNFVASDAKGGNVPLCATTGVITK